MKDAQLIINHLQIFLLKTQTYILALSKKQRYILSTVNRDSKGINIYM